MPEVEYDFREGTLGETLKYLMKNEIGLKKAISGLVRIQQQIIPERFALFKTYPLIEGAPNDFLSNMILSSRDYHPADFAAVGPLMLLKLLADLNEPERLQEMAGKIMGGLQRVASNKIGQGGFIETILMQQLYAGLMKKRENLEGLLVSPERHDKLGIEGVSARDFRYQYYCIPGLEELNVLRTLNLALDFGAVISEINETILEDPARVLFYQIGLVKEAHSYASAIGYDSAASALKSYYDYICEETKKSMGANEYSLDLLRGLILNWPTALKEMAEFQSIYLSGFSRIYPVSRTLQAFGALQKINGSAEIVIAQGLEDSYPAQVDKYLAHFSYHFLETVLQVTSNEEAMKDPLNGYPFFKQPNDFVRTYWNGNYAPFSEYAEKFFGGMFKFFKFIAPFYNKRTEGKELVDQNEIRYFISINDKFHAELSRLQENIKKIGKKLGKL